MPYRHTQKINLRNNFLAAFVLIELLVAVAIFGVVATIVSTTLYTSIKAYYRTQAELNLNQEINQILERLSVELKNCYDAEYDEEQDKGGFIADSSSLSFFTIKDIYSPGDARKSLARFSYRFEEGKLFKKSQIDEQAFLDQANFLEDELLSDIQSLTFEYLYFKKTYSEGEYPYEWKTEWIDKTIIPRGVRIKITKIDSKENISIEVERCIYLAQGEADAQE